MSNVKKTFQPLVDYLNENRDKTVDAVMEKVMEFAAPKGRAKSDGKGVKSTMIKDAKGNVVAIFDYYFKRWMPLIGDAAVEFSKKASAASGFSSMCKAGTSHWTKQQREAKKALGELLSKVEAGDLDIADLPAAREEIEAARQAIEPTDLGFATAEEINDYLESCGIDLADTNCTTEA